MKVVFGCYIYKFHEDYCRDIAEEVHARGGKAIICKDRRTHKDANFTIQPDEAYPRLGGKGVWINHAFPVIPQNSFYLEKPFKKALRKNSDYIFTFSNAWKDWHKQFELPVYVVGMPKLDKLFNTEKKENTIFYAPTGNWKKGVTSDGVVDVSALKKYGDVVYKQHPAVKKRADDKNIKTEQALQNASIVISDYSSVGIESIVLNIPTILVDNSKWDNDKNNHISSTARNAAIRVKTQEEIEQAIQTYIDNPHYLEEERKEYSQQLCDYQGASAKRTVDVLEALL